MKRLSLELLQIYRGDDYARTFERLAAVQQDGIVESFSNEFLACASQVHGIRDRNYLGYFLNGLKSEIRVQI